MSEPEAQDTLEAHGIRWRFNFLADIPDGDGRLYRREPKWVEKDLTPSQRGELEAWIAEHRAARPQDDSQSVRAGNMEHNGVECSHLHGASLIYEKVPSAGFECHTCLAMIVPKDRPETFRFVGGPLDGYYLATGGAQTWRVPLRNAVTAWAGSDEPPEQLAVGEYLRRRNVYVFADKLGEAMG